ncbi:MAG TPA: glycosyltransferase [Phycisphaerae bacterium]|nr:glycosyltransferase [Phycisphaerales bacterium]HRX84747.1 glycosyltransferase [Phycisphaerae bacterium]
MDILITASFIVFTIATLASMTYGLHMAVLLVLFARRQKRERARQRDVIEAFLAADDRANWPLVTTQLPVYNEADVVSRLVEAVTAMDYPRDKHEIQVLDDSTDASRELVDRVVKRYAAQGFDIKVVRRPDRRGYKAGALAHGLQSAKGDLIPVFDADFVPSPDFLKRTVALMVNRPNAACVQGRWGHLNRDESWLTRAQALGIDGHFAIEQGARAWNGLMMNFNGTAGIWRKAAILDPNVGGWSADTLTEDLDLSYRAQLAGWEIEYTVDVVCPAELPGTAQALKSQQRRWATGSIQVARKLLPRIWRARLSLGEKVEATLHLTHYSIALFMLVLAVFARPMLLAWLSGRAVSPWFAWIWSVVCVMAFVPSAVYAYARHIIGEGWGGVRVIPWMLVLGVGICLSNTLAVIRGMYLRGGEFVRTPKSGSTAQRRTNSSYAAMNEKLWIAELGLGAYSLWTFQEYMASDSYFFSIFLLLYGIGFTWMGWLSRPQAHKPAAVAVGTQDLDPAQPQAA